MSDPENSYKRPVHVIVIPALRDEVPSITRRDRDQGLRGGAGYIYKHYIQKQIAEGLDPILFPGEFIRLILQCNSISETDFEHKVGYAPGYFQSNIFNNGVNNGTHHLPAPLQEKLAVLTGTPPEFWHRFNFRASEAENINFDIHQNISHLTKDGSDFTPSTNWKEFMRGSNDLMR